MGGETGKKVGQAALSALLGGGAGLIAGSRTGAGADLRNILKGLGYPKEAPIELPAPPEPAAPQVLEGMRRLAPPIEAAPSQEATLPEFLPLDEPLAPSGTIQQPPDVAMQEAAQKFMEDSMLFALEPDLFQVADQPTVESVTQPFTMLQESVFSRDPFALPAELQDAQVDQGEDLEEPRMSEALTMNGSFVEKGPLRDQVRPTPQAAEAEGLEDVAPVSKPAKENRQLRIDDDGITLLEEFEGRRPRAYQDGGGSLTIGVGHKLTEDELASGKIKLNGKAVSWKEGLTDEQINRLAAQDMASAADAVRRLVSVPLNQDKFNALVSFVFNIGEGAFKSSGALKALNSGNEQEFLSRLLQWNKAGGAVLPGLTRRREFEASLFESGNVEGRR